MILTVGQKQHEHPVPAIGMYELVPVKASRKTQQKQQLNAKL